MPELLVAGMAVADFVMQVENLPQAAEKYRAGRAAVTIGGCAANAAIAIARHGGRPRLAARLGDDLIGGLILDSLVREGIDTALVHRAEGGTSSFSTVAVDRSGERQIVNFRGSGLTTELTWLDECGEPGAVLTDTRWPALAIHVLEIARNRAVPGVIDVEAPIDREAMQLATHLAFSMQGLRDYAPGGTVEDALRLAAGEFDAFACVTDGADGVWFTNRERVDHVPAFPVEAVDTLGAGDIWHGVFALGLAEGLVARDSIVLANGAAALKCRALGGAAACPDRAATEAFIKERTTCR